MARPYKAKLKAYEDLRGALVAERALNIAMLKRLRSMRFELRSVKARANDYAHLLAVNGIGAADRGRARASSGDASAS